MKGFNKVAPIAVGLFAFFNTAKVFADYNNQVTNGQLGGANIGDKLTFFFGMTIYRVGAAFGQNWQIVKGPRTPGQFSFNFPQQSTVGFGFKPWGIINNTTIGASIVLAVVHFFPGIPRAGLIRKAAWFALIGGALGGSVDPTGNRTTTGSALAPPSPSYPQAQAAYVTATPGQGRTGPGGLPY